jgi:hypothetical protein
MRIFCKLSAPWVIAGIDRKKLKRTATGIALALDVSFSPPPLPGRAEVRIKIDG